MSAVRVVALCAAILAASATVGFMGHHPVNHSPLMHPVPGGNAVPVVKPIRVTIPADKPAAASDLAVPARCQAPGPDPACTPGATNPAVTQATIHDTICVPGYSASIRPPESVTEPLKYRLMAAYGHAGESAGGFELDHLIPLEIGGAPLDTRNLWPEPHPGSFAKDAQENRLHADVCDGSIGLRTAQHEMRTWTG